MGLGVAREKENHYTWPSRGFSEFLYVFFFVCLSLLPNHANGLLTPRAFFHLKATRGLFGESTLSQVNAKAVQLGGKSYALPPSLASYENITYVT